MHTGHDDSSRVYLLRAHASRTQRLANVSLLSRGVFRRRPNSKHDSASHRGGQTAMFRLCPPWETSQTAVRLAVASCMLWKTAPTSISYALQINSIIPACKAQIAGVCCRETKQLYRISFPFSRRREAKAT